MRLAAEVTAGIDAALDAIAPPFVLVSSLAEGADRLVVWRGLQRQDVELEAALPLPPDEYMRDFSADSAVEFRALLARARATVVVGCGGRRGATREDAYLAAGLYLVDTCSSLIALWDGAASRGRGGTAEIVAAAESRGLPVTVVPVTRS